jgi:hypothetical protein
MNFNDVGMDNPSLFFPISRVNVNDEVPAIRFLGIYFDPNLNFKYYVKLLNSKLSKALFLLRATKNFLTQQALKSVYYSLFHCNIIYCLPVWSSTAASNLKSIEKMQKTAVRLVCNARYNAHSEPLFKSLHILPFSQLIYFFNLQFMQRYVQGFLPPSFIDVWVTTAMRRQNVNVALTLRNDENFYIPFARLSSTLLQPLVKLPRLWTDFTIYEIKFLREKMVFNNELKKHLLNELSSTVVCNRLFCPSCQHIPD